MKERVLCVRENCIEIILKLYGFQKITYLCEVLNSSIFGIENFVLVAIGLQRLHFVPSP